MGLEATKQLEADAALRHDGVIDPNLDGKCQQSRRTVESHLLYLPASYRSPTLVTRSYPSQTWCGPTPGGFVLCIDSRLRDTPGVGAFPCTFCVRSEHSHNGPFLAPLRS